MAAYIRGQSNKFSSSGSLEEFQSSSVCNQISQTNQEIFSDTKSVWSKCSSNLSNNKLKPKSDLKFPTKNGDQNDEQIQSDLNCAQPNNSVAPKFNVGGVVSSHYQSQPNLNDTVNDYEDANEANFVKESRSFSLHPYSKTTEPSHCIHDQISRTNLACVIQDAIEKSCNFIHIDSTGSKNKSQPQQVKKYKAYQKILSYQTTKTPK